MRSPWLRRAFALWLPAAAAATVVAAFAFVAVQQGYRTSADDPQIQLAEDAARALGAGASPREVTSGPQVDMAASLAPWVVVFAPDGTPIAGTGLFDGHLPEAPSGVLADARAGEVSLTWEPQSGVRSAIVAVPYGDQGGVVLAGRSLKAVEEREGTLTLTAALAWLAALAAAAVGALLGTRLLRSEPTPSASVR